MLYKININTDFKKHRQCEIIYTVKYNKDIHEE